MPNKIKIAVSSCLLGEAVRYDGSDKEIPLISQQLAAQYTLVSLCPEMAVGMGVPRAPIQLVDVDNSIQVLGVDNPNKNMTKPLIKYAEEIVEHYQDICGYIFKKNSPSCGTKNVKVFNLQGCYERRGQGIYAATILNALPLLPVIDEKDCLSESAMNTFLFNVAAYSKRLTT